VAVPGEDIKDALVAAARKAIALYGKPGGVIGFIHTTEDVVDRTAEELKQIVDKHILQELGFNITPDLLDKINEPQPVGEQTQTAASKTAETAKPAKPARRRGNSAQPTPATADSVVEDDPERDAGKVQYKTLIQSALSKYLNKPVDGDTEKQMVVDLTNVLTNNCPTIQNLKISLVGELVTVSSSFGDVSIAVVPSEQFQSTTEDPGPSPQAVFGTEKDSAKPAAE
jgi:hypothetical protein